MPSLPRRDFLRAAGAVAAAAALPARAARRPPNLVVLFADDLGYGDLGCFGHPTLRTPHLDRLAAEGARLTQFYSAAEVCTPSRAALLTGRYPMRCGMASDRRRVLFPNSGGGLPTDEITLADRLKQAGYATACIGKWHLGHLPQYLPTRRGFDQYYGIPYSNDMRPCPLMEDERVIEEPVDQTTLTRRYTERAIRFIEANQARPFFIYFPHTFPHVPLYASDRFLDTSPRGLYGDVVEELDWSCGQIIDALRRLKLSEQTLVIFTSDNGPWLIQRLRGGSAGLLRGGKGSTWEGGMREPTIAWWPGHIASAQTVTGLGSTLDLMATGCALAGCEPPDDRTLDSHNLLPMLTGDAVSPRRDMFYWRGRRFMAARLGPWKAHYVTHPGYGNDGPAEHDPPLLFQLEHDPGEQYNVAGEHPEVLVEIAAAVAAHRAGLADAPASQLDLPLPEGMTPGPA